MRLRRIALPASQRPNKTVVKKPGAFGNATRHVGRNRIYRNKHDDTIRTTVASCYLSHASASQDEAEQIANLVAHLGYECLVLGAGHPNASSILSKAMTHWRMKIGKRPMPIILKPSVKRLVRKAICRRCPRQRLRIVRPYQKTINPSRQTEAGLPKKNRRKNHPESGRLVKWLRFWTCGSIIWTLTFKVQGVS